MIRKPTVILLGLFALVLLAGWVMEFSPWKPEQKTEPTATPRPRLFDGLSPTEITLVDILSADGQAISVVKNEQGQFSFDGDTNTTQPDPGVMQQLISELIALEVRNSVDPTSSLEILGLQNATSAITLHTEKGLQRTVLIGEKTPTGNGYYVRVDAQTPAVVDSAAIEQILSLITREALTATTATPPAP